MIEHFEITFIDNIVCLPGEGQYRAVVMADVDLTELMPYINGYVKGAKYMPGINWIRFSFNGYPDHRKKFWQVAIKGREIMIAKFGDRNEAAEMAGELIGFLNSIYKAQATITPDTRAWTAPHVMDLLKHLPRTNCKKCGYQSCMAFATALVAEQAMMDACPDLCAAPDELAKIKELLGM